MHKKWNVKRPEINYLFSFFFFQIIAQNPVETVNEFFLAKTNQQVVHSNKNIQVLDWKQRTLEAFPK